MKLFARFAVIVVLVFVVLGLAKNAIAKFALTTGVKAVTGLQLNIEEMKVGLVGTWVGVKGMWLLNPPGYNDDVMLKVGDLLVDYSVPALLTGTIRFEQLRLNVDEIIIEKNDQGKLNLSALKDLSKKAPKAGAEEPEAPAKKEPAQGKKTNLRVDVLEYRIGKVTYKDYSAGTPPKVQEFNINLHGKLENVTDPRLMVAGLVSKAVMSTSLSRLTDLTSALPLGSLGESFDKASSMATDAAAAAAKTALQATGDVKDIGTNTLNSAQGAVEETLKGTTDKLKKLLPLGQ